MKDSFSLKSQIKKETGISVMDCYQCGKCSAGCPMSEEMEYPPSVVMRMLQSDESELSAGLISSNTIWYCITCEICYGRCPMEIDIPSIMDYLRRESVKQNKIPASSKNIVSFHKAFLNSIKMNGKLHELGLIVDYKMRSFKLMQDIALAPKMLLKGKLHIIPRKNKGIKNIKKIFAMTQNK